MRDIEKDRMAVDRYTSQLEELRDEEIVRREQKVTRRAKEETSQLEEL